MSRVALLVALWLSSACFAEGAKVDAEAAKSLIVQNFCNACHDADMKMLGPAYKDVAAKYRSDKDALEKLAAKVRKGGGGIWGEVPMPANPGVKDEELKTILTWVLSL
ncbi:MAG: c-type cytochrome [Betaproteobacteria bacterium]|nr:c-type cytochrome [Betaproteobacteria bacterium]